MVNIIGILYAAGPGEGREDGMAKVNLPYGIDDFVKVRESNCYYIDKTGFIKELLDRTFDVNLITRPRRFGKTLTMRMLGEFFDIRTGKRRCVFPMKR